MHSIRRLGKSILLAADRTAIALLRAVTWFAFRQKRDVILLRLDGIGDYLLFRSFIAVLHDSRKYRGHSITLCGNLQWKDLAEGLDDRWVSHFVWIDRSRFLRSRAYKYYTVFRIRLRSYQVLIHPTYSRDWMSDFVVSCVRADVKIGNTGDDVNLPAQEKEIFNREYSVLLQAQGQVLFEFDRNREFFETLLSEKISLQKPIVQLTCLPRIPSARIEGEYAVLFIGAGEKKRKWGALNFAGVARYLRGDLHFHVVVAGGSEDVDDAAKVLLASNDPGVMSVAGKTSLLDLAVMLKSAALLVTNDTGILHLAASLGTKVVCVSIANYFGRFCEYPPEMGLPVYCVYPEPVAGLLHDAQHLKTLYRRGSRLQIEDVKQADVIRVIECAMHKSP